MAYFIQLRWSNLWLFALEALIIYNLFQISKQTQLVYLIGYKFIMLFYIG